LPRKRLMWTERMLDFWTDKVIRIKKKAETSGWWWALGRVSFLFVVWLSGLALHALDGLMIPYALDLRPYALLFGLSFITFIGSNALRNSLDWFFPFVRPLLNLDDSQFEKFHNRIERFATSIFPVLGLALVLIVCLPNDIFKEAQKIFVSGTPLRDAWTVGFNFFILLIVATGIWIISSNWLTIFFMSRQPLKLELSRETSKIFRPLGRWVLWNTAFYFVGVGLGVPQVSALIEIAVVYYLLFSMFGAFSAIIPFYNIHKILIRLKKQELQKINDESEKLVNELNGILTSRTTENRRDQVTIITARLLSLQIKEKSIREFEEWPVSMGFFRTVASLVVMPTIIKIVIELITKELL